MAKMVKKSALAGKIGQALKSHAQDETDYGTDFTNLPPGIVGGVARLVTAQIGVYKKGNYEGEKFLRLAGTVVEPDEANVVRKVFQEGKVVNMPVETVRIKGLQTSQMFPLCDTTNGKGETTDADDNIATALNALRMLGGEEFTAGLAEAEDPEAELESLLESLVEAAPYFKFNTRGSTPTAQYPDERTWEDWRGAIADYVQDEAPAVEDKSSGGDDPEDEGGDEQEVGSSEDGGEDLEALAEAADRNDEDDEECVNAQNRLTELASEAGIDGDAKDKRGKPVYPTWASLAEALKPGEDTGDDEEGEPEDEGDWKPAKEEVYNCKFPKSKKAVEVEITAVNEKKQTVSVKRLDTGHVVKDVSWDCLEQ